MNIAIFVAVMLYASYYDIQYRVVPLHIHLLLILTGLLNVSLLNIMYAVICFIPMFITAMMYKQSPIGGGDVKICAGIGFCLGFSGLIAIMIGAIYAVIIQGLIRVITKKKSSYPLIPYLTAGSITTLIILI